MLKHHSSVKNGSNPLVIIVLSFGALFALIYFGSQSSGSGLNPMNIISSLLNH